MKLSRRVARFNKLINNRVQRPYSWVLPPWSVIVHRGRRSGRLYRTPVLAFRHGDEMIIALLYGEESDWLRNLRAGSGQLVRGGRTYAISGAPRLVETSSADDLLAGLPAPARRYCRLADKQVVLALGERRPGFGPGPLRRRGGSG
jgi:deazaflavin-dependent oxidoreductase (nitroreductase family)